MNKKPVPRRWRPASRSLRLIALAAAVAAVAIVGVNLMLRRSAEAALERRTAEQAIPTVKLVSPTRSPATQELTLPGTVQALIEAPIYARTSGYVKSWKTDIGTKVTKGQLLAEIDTPEVDDQYRQAEADLKTAEANERLARLTSDRWAQLVKTSAVSRQAADEKVADAAAKSAMVASAKANVARLAQQQMFRRVVSPFDGIVTARRTDVGALINAGSAAGTELFRVADSSVLRIYVQVPENSAPRIRPETPAALRFPAFPGRDFPAKVVRTAGSIDPTVRTMLVELQTDNAKGELFPGSYAEVHFQIAVGPDSIRLPVNTLLFRADGSQVAMVDSNGTVELRKVQIGLDFGNAVEILSGLTPQDQVVVNPSDSIAAGQKVHVAKDEPAAK